MAQDLVAQVPDGLTRQLARSMIGTQSKETGLKLESMNYLVEGVIGSI